MFNLMSWMQSLGDNDRRGLVTGPYIFIRVPQLARRDE
jgi:hypothetical protein